MAEDETGFGHSSLNIRMKSVDRDFGGYTSLISRLASKFRPLDNQGLESHLFCDGDVVLKVYQWFILCGRGLDEELRLWERQQWLLSIYAPQLQAQVVAISQNGEILPMSSKSFCYGLQLTRGEPFLQAIWNKASVSDRERWAEGIAIALAEYHLAAPQQSLSKPYHRGALIEQAEKVLGILDSLQSDVEALPLPRDCILDAIHTLLDSEQFDPVLALRPSHGDPTLSNIVLTAKDNIQLIDPGPALLAGIGVENPDLWQLDIWWDVAVLSKSFLEHGGKQIRQTFLKAYLERAGVSESASLLKFRYWLVLYYLMVIAVCLKRRDDFHSESNPFAMFLKSRGITLGDYLRYFLDQVLEQLDIVVGQSPSDRHFKDMFG